ncbi:MAG: CRTAC1 family protein [Chloracidobacterium sp.]|nr:CRTAC1 family protein [Chloracidobacterium sp.]
MGKFVVALLLFMMLAAGAERPALFEIVPPSSSGVTFVHNNALSPRRYLPESMGPGVAIFDYDNDGWMDIYFTNSGKCDFFQPKQPLRNALYRNNGDGTFTDVTEKAGVAGHGFGIGVAAADYNCDGWTDLFVTNYGSNILYRNNGNGSFTDVTKEAGLGAPGLYTSSVWFDYDRDGALDLFVGHFVKYNQSLERKCEYDGAPHYCYPLSYDPFPSKLYHNNRDGSFTDVSEASGIGKLMGKTFGAVATDINNDGWLDLFVANDSVPNFLFLNQGDGTFKEIGFEAEVAFNSDGAARSGMGVDAADYDGDGLEDLFVANFNRERFSIYRNRGDNSFSDEAGQTGIGVATQMLSGWGLRFFDFDLDGDPDLIVCNGHPDDLIETISTTLKHKEPILLFENRGKEFVNLGAAAGGAFARDYPARGLAVGDLNNDGYPDVVIGNNGEAPLILRHTRATSNHWVGLSLIGNATGARITWSAGGVKRSRLKTAGGSYLSSQDPRESLGLGAAKTVDWIEVRWPGVGNKKNGRVDRFENVAVDRYYSLKEGGNLQ